MSSTDEQPQRVRRRCPMDMRIFTPGRRTQVYCCKRCRKLAGRLKQTGAKNQPLFRRTLSLPAVLARISDERSMRGLPELGSSEYLARYAAVVEAQMQIATWQARLAEREKTLGSTTDPGYLMRRIVLRPGEPLDLPAGYREMGVASTEPSLAIVCLGRPDDGKADI